jgi:hypothetical protein
MSLPIKNQSTQKTIQIKTIQDANPDYILTSSVILVSSYPTDNDTLKTNGLVEPKELTSLSVIAMNGPAVLDFMEFADNREPLPELIKSLFIASTNPPSKKKDAFIAMIHTLYTLAVMQSGDKLPNLTDPLIDKYTWIANKLKENTFYDIKNLTVAWNHITERNEVKDTPFSEIQRLILSPKHVIEWVQGTLLLSGSSPSLIPSAPPAEVLDPVPLASGNPAPAPGPSGNPAPAPSPGASAPSGASDPAPSPGASGASGNPAPASAPSGASDPAPSPGASAPSGASDPASAPSGASDPAPAPGAPASGAPDALVVHGASAPSGALERSQIIEKLDIDTLISELVKLPAAEPVAEPATAAQNSNNYGNSMRSMYRNDGNTFYDEPEAPVTSVASSAFVIPGAVIPERTQIIEKPVAQPVAVSIPDSLSSHILQSGIQGVLPTSTVPAPPTPVPTSTVLAPPTPVPAPVVPASLSSHLLQSGIQTLSTHAEKKTVTTSGGTRRKHTTQRRRTRKYRSIK